MWNKIMFCSLIFFIPHIFKTYRNDDDDRANKCPDGSILSR